MFSVLAKLSKILVFGATSAIVKEILKLYANENLSFFLTARDNEKLKSISDELLSMGAEQVEIDEFDALNPESIDKTIDKCLSIFPDIDGVLIAHGILPDQKECETNYEAVKEAFEVNFLSAVKITTIMANYFEKRGRGFIGAISSIAGERGRQKNYIYGSTKGALTTYLSGLRQRMNNKGVKVLTIIPGVIDTPMTSKFPDRFFYTTPQKIAKKIKKAIEKDRDVIYCPNYWKYIMLLIRIIPERIFKQFNF